MLRASDYTCILDSLDGFGDANTSTSQNPVHTYSGPGVYVVCLIVTGGVNGAICRDTICKDVVIVQSGCDCDSSFFAAVAAGYTTSGTNPVTFTPFLAMAIAKIPLPQAKSSSVLGEKSSTPNRWGKVSRLTRSAKSV